MSVGPLLQCQGCAEEIRFVRTTAGKLMPVNGEPVTLSIGEGPGHPVVVLVDDKGRVWRGPLDGPRARPVAGYVPHWSTCPEAKRFKRASRQ